MIASNVHEDLNTPPNIPIFSGKTDKKSRQQESISDVISGAAVAIVKVLNSDSRNMNEPTVTPTQLPVAAGVSPAKSVELRMKNDEQLRYRYQLFDDGEHKNGILIALKKL